MKTLVISSQKGGVGKTAVAVLLAEFLDLRRKRVLAIDLDHQGHLGARLIHGSQPRVAPFSSDSLLTGAVEGFEPLRMTVIPSSHRLLELPSRATLHRTAASRLRAFLDSMDESFDVCIVDTAGIPDVLLVSALSAADFVLYPIRLDDPAMDSVADLLSDPRVGLRVVAARNPKLRILGVLPNMVEGTPFQQRNFAYLVGQHCGFLIPCEAASHGFAHFPRRTTIEQAQMSGPSLWSDCNSRAYAARREVEPSLTSIAAMLMAGAEA